MKYRVLLLCIVFHWMTLCINVAMDTEADVGSACSWKSHTITEKRAIKGLDSTGLNDSIVFEMHWDISQDFSSTTEMAGAALFRDRVTFKVFVFPLKKIRVLQLVSVTVSLGVYLSYARSIFSSHHRHPAESCQRMQSIQEALREVLGCKVPGYI